MDVGDPSNFVRLLRLFDNDLLSIQNILTAHSISDAVTKQTIQDVFKTHNYLLDPHGAVGYKALQHYLDERSESQGIFLETAHPVKFYDVVEPVINSEVPIPDAVQGLFSKKKQSLKMEASSEELKAFLMERVK
jgi:threonine synthase